MVVVILITFVAVFLNRAELYQEQAEKMAMAGVVDAVQSQLLMNFSYLMLQQDEGAKTREAKIVALSSENPMSWMAKVPDNYTGEFYDLPPDKVTPGSWFFDLKSSELVYAPERKDHFVPGEDGQDTIRYRVKLRYGYASGVSADADKMLVGISFEPVEPYHWLD